MPGDRGEVECGIEEWIANGPGETVEMIDMFIILIRLTISQVYTVYIHLSKHVKLYILNSTVYCSSVIHQSCNSKKNVFIKEI